MAIKFVLNGYYRSGTTILFKILKVSNPNYYCLCEPLNGLFAYYDNPPKFKKLVQYAMKLHGFNPFADYNNFLKHYGKFFKSRVFSKFKTFGDVVPISLNEIAPLFDFLNNLDKDCIIQPNRCHFILSQICEKYFCHYIHIIRNPVDTWFSQTIEMFALTDNNIKAKLLLKYRNNLLTKWIIRIVLTNYINIKNISVCQVSKNFSFIKNKFNLNYSDNIDLLDKMLIVWTYVNYHAFKQAEKDERGMIVYYEQVTKNPKKWLKIMSDFSGINFDLKFAKILNPRITKDDKLKEHFVERLEKLELIDMVDEFYSPENWFG